MDLNEFYRGIFIRFRKYGITEISEESIRYDFMTSVFGKVDPTDIAFKYPHVDPIGGRDYIDCMVNDPVIYSDALEFRFFNPLANGAKMPILLAGELFRDIFKLADCRASRKWLVLISDMDMTFWLQNHFSSFNKPGFNPFSISIGKVALDMQGGVFQKFRSPYPNIALRFERTLCETLRNNNGTYLVAVFEIR